jgi:anti-sigma regulatory factor (Ser/Thr protein kinase)
VPEPLAPGGREIRARFAADPASVPGVRRFVSDSLRAWGRETLVDDAMLCVSELAGNAALHSAGTCMEVSLRRDTVGRDNRNIRISVEDDGPVPGCAVRPHLSLADLAADGDLSPENEPATGRGLTIVSFLAGDWGVEQLARGKRVWAELGESADGPVVAAPRTVHGLARRTVAGMLDGWVHLVLRGTPVELFLRESQHLDELVREMQLIAHDTANPEAPALAARLRGVLTPPKAARNTARRIAEQAARDGRDQVDMRLPVPRTITRDLREIVAAFEAADQLGEEMRLLTLATPPEMRELRGWVLHQVIGQVERAASPVSWPEWSGHRS